MLSVKLLVAGPAAASALVLLYRFLARTERRGEGCRVVNWVVVLVVTESLLWGQNDTPVGPFHPQIGSQNFRLYDVLLPLALLARIRVQGRPRHITMASLALIVFFAWYVVCAAIGEVGGNGATEVFYQLKTVIYIGGSYALVAGTPLRDLLGPSGLPRLVKPLAVISGLFALTSVAHVSVSVDLPAIRIVAVTGVFADAAAVLIGIGWLGLLTELCAARRSRSRIVASVVLLATPLTSDQRAVLLQLGATVLVGIIAWTFPTGRRRFTTTPTDLLMVGLAATAIILVIPLAQGRSPFMIRSLPLGHQITQTFGSEAKVQSAQQRINQLQQLEVDIPERPVFGWGLGKTIVYDANGQYTATGSPVEVDSSISHNLAGDLLLRGGAVALVLFILGFAAPCASALSAWRHHADPQVAAAALAAVAVVVGILVHGSVESILEKYRVAVALGLFLGLAEAAATTAQRHPLLLGDDRRSTPVAAV